MTIDQLYTCTIFKSFSDEANVKYYDLYDLVNVSM